MDALCNRDNLHDDDIYRLCTDVVKIFGENTESSICSSENYHDDDLYRLCSDIAEKVAEKHNFHSIGSYIDSFCKWYHQCDFNLLYALFIIWFIPIWMIITLKVCRHRGLGELFFFVFGFIIFYPLFLTFVWSVKTFVGICGFQKSW